MKRYIGIWQIFFEGDFDFFFTIFILEYLFYQKQPNEDFEDEEISEKMDQKMDSMFELYKRVGN